MEMQSGRGILGKLNTPAEPFTERTKGIEAAEYCKEETAMPTAGNELEILQVRKLIQCAREQDTGQILKLLDGGVPNLVNYQDPSNGTTALHVAVTLNLDRVVGLLLENGASNSLQDKEGCTSLMRACQHGHLQSLEQLAMKGLPMQVADGGGLRALFHCLHPTGRHVKCLSFLLDHGAEPNTKTLSGLPVLCAAAKEGLEPHLEKLLDKGADPNARDPSSGKAAVIFATEEGHPDCLRLLALAGADLNASFGDSELNSLHRAASLGMFECIQVLSAYGADFTAVSKTGDTALHFATVAYRLLCIRLLGQRGCPANEVNEEGLTPQKIAKADGIKDAMKELKKLTVYQDKVGKGGKPKGFAESWCIRLFDWLQVNKILVWESLKNCIDNRNGVLPVETFKTLLAEGMDAPITEDDWPKLLKIYDKKNEGVLNWEDLITDHKYIHAQFKLGPNDDIKAKKGKKGKKKGGKKGGKKGKTKILFPIYFEAERPPVAGVSDGMIEKEEYLTDFQRFSSPLPNALIDDSPWYLMPQEPSYVNLYEAIRHGDFDSIELALMEAGMCPDARDKYNKTPLMIAAAHGRCDVAEYLISKGADVNAIDNFIWTPLHHACHAGEEAVVRLLLNSGAIIDKQSFNGGTPIMRAIESSQRDIVKLLLERGAKLNFENSHGDTALDIARNWGDEIIYVMVYAVAAKQPPPESDGKKDKKKEDKKKGGKKGKGKGKKDEKAPTVIPGPPIVPLPLPSRLPTAQVHVEESRKQYSLASLQAETVIKPITSPRPRQAWGSDQLSPRRFHQQMDKDREQRGIEVIDFGEMRTPFQIQVTARAKSLEMTDL